MADVWGPWIEHNGKGCPCVGMWVQAEIVGWTGAPFTHGRFDGRVWEVRATGKTSWGWKPRCEKVIRYRIRRPRALVEMIERAESLPAPKRDEVPA